MRVHGGGREEDYAEASAGDNYTKSVYLLTFGEHDASCRLPGQFRMEVRPASHEAAHTRPPTAAPGRQHQQCSPDTALSVHCLARPTPADVSIHLPKHLPLVSPITQETRSDLTEKYNNQRCYFSIKDLLFDNFELGQLMSQSIHVRGACLMFSGVEINANEPSM